MEETDRIITAIPPIIFLFLISHIAKLIALSAAMEVIIAAMPI